MEKILNVKYVQINACYNGSTGTIMRNSHKELQAQGHDSYIFWGRGHKTISDHEQCCGSRIGVYWHGLMTRLFGKIGFYSKRDTKKLLKQLDEINPDIVHLHNIHGYYINIEMLFNWLVKHDCQVKWTLHDCWAFTGHCAYFTYVKCAQWQSHCAYDQPCPQITTYPKTYSKSSCKWNFEQKNKLFTTLPKDKMTLVTPSQWLADLVKKSFLSKYPVEVRHNTVDTTIFKPTPSDFRRRYGLEDKFVILGVASPWTERKGLSDFVRLSQELDERFAIVLVGLNKKQMKHLPKQIIALPRTDTPKGLAAIYTASDVFVNPSVEETFGMTVVEAQACETPAIVEKNSACEEAAKLNKNADVLVADSDFESLKATIIRARRGGVVVLLSRADSAQQLAAIYSAANVLFNPTKEDNYPTVNLEAEACGTPVITYDTGGCRETIHLITSHVV